MTHALVTGAAGFLGFHLARALADRPGLRVTMVDNFVRGEEDAHYRALGRRPNVTRIDADLSVVEEVARLPDDVDYIYHMAALNGTQNFYERPMDVIRFSTLPTIFLVEKYGRRAHSLRRFIYAGTSESYALMVSRFGWPIPTAEDVPLGIADVFNPRWSYAASKMHGEVVVAQGARAMGFPMTIARFHNAYGPRMGDKHVIPDFYARMRAGRYELYGHADTRSFLYVDDAVRATMMAAESDACAGEVVNVGGQHEIDMLALARRMVALAGLDEEIMLHPSPAGSVKRRAPDVSKLNAATGFVEGVPLDEGLRATARFYLEDELVGRLHPAALPERV